LNFLFALRYFKAKKSTNAINIIAGASIAAMVFGTAALILVLSVYNGFEDLVKDIYSTFYTDLKISPAAGKVISITPQQLEKVKAIKGIKNFSLVAEEKGVLQNGEIQSVVYLKGVDENHQYIAGIKDHLVKGNYELGDADNPLVLLGAGVENAVGVQADRNIIPLIIYLPKKADASITDPMKAISGDTINTAGTFLIQQEFDNKYAVTNLGFMKQMLSLGADEYSALEIGIHDFADAKDVQESLKKIFNNNYSVQTRYQQNQSLYSVMQAEKWVIYAVLCLILIVASFTMISSLTMLVLEKQKDISVLHALGANNSFIQKIFLSEGMLLAGIGTIVGMLLALFIAWLQVTYKLIPMQGGTFLIDHFPVKLKLPDFLLVGVTVFIISLIASWIPARKAANRDFSLRSE
jgi:lipoprotein-releasing system permease protein